MVFGLFSKDRAIERAIKKTTNKHAQSADRLAAMEKLRDFGSHEALVALCRRFSFASSKSIEDEQEKQWVVDALAEKGEDSVEPLHQYMKSAPTVAFPLRVLERVAPEQRRLEVVDDLLADEEPGYTKDTKKRIQIIDWLAELDDVDESVIVSRIKPYLEDFDENVRFAAAEALALHPSKEAAEPLVSALLRQDEESLRLKRRIGEILAENGLDLCGRKSEVGALTENVLSDFRLHKDKLALRK